LRQALVEFSRLRNPFAQIKISPRFPFQLLRSESENRAPAMIIQIFRRKQKGGGTSNAVKSKSAPPKQFDFQQSDSAFRVHRSARLFNFAALCW
jgi:hypothetical protein